MDDPRVLRILTVGLVLASLAVGYFLLTGGLGVKSKKTQTQTTKLEEVVVSPAPPASPIATQSAYLRILNRTQSNVQKLPSTGFPVGLAIIFSVGIMISGMSLRKFPK